MGAGYVPSIIQLDLSLFGPWLIAAVAAVAVLYIVLRVVRKMVSTSLRVAILVGAVVVIAAALCVFGMLLNPDGLPIP